ncbi:hypothetical protein MMON_58080 [Mycolicibacterium monacense]|uniref:Uncharacterized protein n=1 Tax=Mycolicibacterium monacense TaxID=85693 RepID=A0AAD1N2P9_MYCMB|nr:hypothetical protein MMON_58080 [Mycolicibacterium monacense]
MTYLYYLVRELNTFVGQKDSTSLAPVWPSPRPPVPPVNGVGGTVVSGRNRSASRLAGGSCGVGAAGVTSPDLCTVMRYECGRRRGEPDHATQDAHLCVA